MTVIGKWDVSHVTNLSHVFDAARTGKAANFNDDITGWDTGNVLDMSNMFRGTKVFKQNIGNWNVSRVTDMCFMFSDATMFNQILENLNMANVAYIGSVLPVPYLTIKTFWDGIWPASGMPQIYLMVPHPLVIICVCGVRHSKFWAMISFAKPLFRQTVRL